MKLKEVLVRRDQLKNHIYALKRSVSLCQMHLKDEEMIQHLTEIKQDLEGEYNELSQSLKPIEETEI